MYRVFLLFFYLLVTLDTSRRRSVFHPSVTIKQGYLWKRRWGHGKFMTSFIFKKRYFWLKYDTLAYAKKPNDQVRLYRAIRTRHCLRWLVMLISACGSYVDRFW